MMIYIRVFIILAIQTAVLLSMVFDRAEVLAEGKSVILKTRPVDPRSLFRGYYVNLDYEISVLNLKSLEGDSDFERWQTVYVTLEERGDHWAATGVYKEWPRVVGSQVVIEGVIWWINHERLDCRGKEKTCWDQEREQESLSVEYGLDSYFVPEGEGLIIEEAIREREDRVKIEVAIDATGESAIKGLYLDDKLLYAEPPY